MSQSITENPLSDEDLPYEGSSGLPDEGSYDEISIFEKYDDEETDTYDDDEDYENAKTESFINERTEEIPEPEPIEIDETTEWAKYLCAIAAGYDRAGGKSYCSDWASLIIEMMKIAGNDPEKVGDLRRCLDIGGFLKREDGREYVWARNHKHQFVIIDF